MQPVAEIAGWLFGWLLRNSVHAAILAAVVALLEATVCRRLPPRWRYGLWLLVVARLLIPIAPGSSLSLFNLVDLAPGALAGATLEVLGLPAPLPVPVPEPAHPLADTPAWFLAALALWLPGAVVLAGLLGRDHRRLHRALAATRPVTDTRTLSLLQQSQAVMRVRTPVALVETPRMPSPAISGWWRPRLLLPEGLLERLTPDETRFLFLHELAHVKRADLLLNWVLAAVQVLHWFNPAVWLALRRLLNVREEVCDDLVLRRCFTGAARDYGLTLLRLLEECAPRRLVPSLAGILDDLGSLRTRMRSIRAFRSEEASPWIPATLTVSLAVAGLTDHRSRHVLFAAAPSAGEIEHHSRWGSVRGQQASPTRRVPARAKESEESVPLRREAKTPAASTLAQALRQAAADARTAHPRPALTGRPAGSFAPQAPPRPLAAPGPGTLANRSPDDAAARGRRLYPLPPVGQRGDILRPPRGAGDRDLAPPTGRAVEIVPYFGRQAIVPAPPGVRPNS